ncbi:MAG: SRPBCC domain-containing protein [Methylobacter sp.]|nr:SRPBCC domain-containing protein [Methylobacter sp.]
MTFRPTVLVALPNHELRWLGHFLLPRVFDGEHYFKIEPVSSGRVRLIHGEKFSGILVGLAKSKLEGETKSGFIAMNQALKNQAEAV